MLRQNLNPGALRLQKNLHLVPTFLGNGGKGQVSVCLLHA